MFWKIADKSLNQRFILGTALYPSPQVMQDAIRVADCQVITVSIRRQIAHQSQEASHSQTFWSYIKQLGCHILPNTAACKSADEAIQTAHMARELFQTNWIKLEVIGDDYNLAPNPFELLKACQQLIKDGFTVFPYTTDDLIVAQHLVDLGCKIIMPGVAPIGSGQGVCNPQALRTLRKRLPDTTLIVDAGIGKPSDACQVMEMGFDAVLLNSAVALAHDPVMMAGAFRQSIQAGHQAYQAGLMTKRNFASPSTPLLGGKALWQE